MKTINNLIYGYIVGDSFGLSKINNYDNELKLKFNDNLNIDKGEYSYMSTFMLCVMDSISNSNCVDVEDIMNKMCTSLIVGKYTNNGKIYNIDRDTVRVLDYYSRKNNLNYSIDESDYNAYSIARVLPIIIYNFYNEDTLDNLIPVLSLTNVNEVVHLGCYIYYKYVMNLMEGLDKYKALKFSIPKYFSSKSIKYYKNILKGNIYYKDIKFDDNIINVLKVVFYVVLNSDNYTDMFNMISNLEGNINIYSSLIMSIGGILYGKENIPVNIYRDIKNKKDINKYIKKFERMFL